MRERGIAFLLALAALTAFYALWLRPTPSLDPDGETARPTSAERRGNGYAGLFEWLQNSGVDTRSFRERYTALPDLEAPTRGNLLVLSLPAVEVFHSDEFGALDKWVRRGNTLLINAALLDQPEWAARRSSGAVVDIEALTAIEFETRKAREARLDDTPLAEHVREADARAAKKKAKPGDDDADEDDDEDSEDEAEGKVLDVPEKIVLHATGPHALLQGVKTLALETDYPADEWSLRMPYDNFVLTLARAANGEGALFEQRVGAGSVLLCAGGSLFTNRTLGDADNARLFANIVSARVARDGVVLFDDLRQGLSANYDPARFYRDPRLLKTVFIMLGLWFVWVLGSTRLRAPAIESHDPSEAELVRRAGGLLARTVAPHHTALRLFDHFFAGVARAARRAGGASSERGELWQWLERHAAILPQELDRLKTWYADAHSERKLPLVPLQNLLDTLEKRLKT
ncbi:MAG TPA: DUF4350 domain-containing protein [Steroidobacteraceae bacterium]|jgi:hypothetical protein|nr:DUF4350 domain-containing protein [Steroidobacteraceae bacterium]